MAKSKRAYLREELSKRFIPYLRSKGFERAEESAKADGRSTFPFGTLMRKHGTTLDIIEIQFDKYSRPKFMINFRKDPPEILKEGRSKSRSLKWSEAEAFRLHPRPNSAAWFTMRTVFGLRSSESCSKEIVDHLMNLLPEIESWFNDGNMGKHLRRCPYVVFSRCDHQDGSTS